MVGQLSRLFVAVTPPPEIKMALDDRLSRLALPGRLVPPENWHVTIRFLGSVEPATQDRFLGALSTSALGPPFKVTLGVLGAFPNGRRATVLWVAIAEGTPHLALLAELADDAAANAGISDEERPFHPHLTLARIRPQEDVSSLVGLDVGTNLGWRCNELILYESVMGKGHPLYVPLERIGLTR